MKITKNIPIYVLSASLVWVGISAAGQAQGAGTDQAAAIAALQKQVKAIQDAAAVDRFLSKGVSDRMGQIENRLSTIENSILHIADKSANRPIGGK